jgi:hypothetical protein
MTSMVSMINVTGMIVLDSDDGVKSWGNQGSLYPKVCLLGYAPDPVAAGQNSSVHLGCEFLEQGEKSREISTSDFLFHC